MTRLELIKLLLTFDLDKNWEAKSRLLKMLNERSAQCFLCHSCFAGFGEFTKIINPELNKRCNDIWYNSEVKEL